MTKMTLKIASTIMLSMSLAGCFATAPPPAPAQLRTTSVAQNDELERLRTCRTKNAAIVDFLVANYQVFQSKGIDVQTAINAYQTAGANC